MKDEKILNSTGVSNLQPCDLEIILETCRQIPVINQIEFHPYLLAHLEPLLELQKQNSAVIVTHGCLTPITRGLKGPLDDVLSRIPE